MSLSAAIETAIGVRPTTLRALSDGHNARLWLAILPDGRRLVAKAGRGLETEGFMLRHLAAGNVVPVPAVHFSDESLLVMDYIETGGSLDARAEEHAADLIAALHDIHADRFGFSRTTPIGSLPQDNTEHADWLTFFRDRRLLPMARAALREHRIDAGLMAGLDRVADHLDSWIDAAVAPTLIHGDLWGGNVLVAGGRVAAFIDPALYHADPEIELAFTTLFGTFGERFFARYAEHHPLRPGFFDVRRDLYNLYPLLVHVRLFGASYVAGVERIVRHLAG